jgi:hypothetical protein
LTEETKPQKDAEGANTENGNNESDRDDDSDDESDNESVC